MMGARGLPKEERVVRKGLSKVGKSWSPGKGRRATFLCWGAHEDPPCSSLQ